MEFEISIKPVAKTTYSLSQRCRTLLHLHNRSDRDRRTIKPLQRYGEADLVAYAFSVAESIDSSKEFSTYVEASSYDY